MTHARFGALSALLLLTACASSSAPEGGSKDASSPELQAQVALVDARRLMVEGQPRDAMVELDTALELEAEPVETLFLRGEATLRLGVEDGNAFFFEDSRAAFRTAAESGQAPAAWFGAARATWMLYYQSGDAQHLEEALGYLERGRTARAAGDRLERYLGETPERTVAEVGFTAYTAAKGGTLAEERAPELFEAARDALEAEIALDPTSAWGWGQLANLYLWEERREDARTTLATAIALSPTETGLHEARVRLAQEDGGWPEVERLYGEFSQEHDGAAIGHWWLGRAVYEQALEGLLAEQDDRGAAFERAETELARTRELEPSFAEACMAYEVICRDGRGWSAYYAGDLAAAEEAFWSMEELFEGGIQWEVQERLWSGVRSLNFLLSEHYSSWTRVFEADSGVTYPEAFASLQEAARLANRLFEYDADDKDHANNAGFFNRDVAVQYELQGTQLLTGPPAETEESAETEQSGEEAENAGDDSVTQAAADEASAHEDRDEEEAAAREEQAREAFARAREHMELSYEAYQRAAELAPRDARVINDTGLILAYYLQRDLDAARDYFERSIAVGLPQLEAGIEDEEERTMTREAVGDAYQNLGVVALTLEGDAATARRLFEKSLEYERAPRVQVTTFFLPLCARVESGEIPAARVIEAHYWKDLEVSQVLEREAVMAELREELARR